MSTIETIQQQTTMGTTMVLPPAEQPIYKLEFGRMNNRTDTGVVVGGDETNKVVGLLVERMNVSGVSLVRGACDQSIVSACLKEELLVGLDKMLALPGRASDNRHFIHIETETETETEQGAGTSTSTSTRTIATASNSNHQSNFRLPLSSGVKEVLRSALSSSAGKILLRTLGRDAEISKITMITSEPGSGLQYLHSDACWSESGPRLISMFLALEDIKEDMGMTRFYADTYAPHCFPGGKWLPPPDEYSHPHPEAVEILQVHHNNKNCSPVSYELQAGDCVLMDSTTWHRGGNNISDRRRSILTIAFVAAARTKAEGQVKEDGDGKLRLGDFIASRTERKRFIS